MSFRDPSSTKLFSGKIAKLYNRVKTRVFGAGQTHIQAAISNVSVILKKFFTRLQKPLFSYRPIAKGDFVNADSYNNSIEDIKDDLDLMHEESTVAARMSAEVFNIGLLQSAELNRRAAEAASKVADLRLLGGQLDGQTIIAGDDFQDTSRVDGQYATQFPKASVSGREGVCTLNRLSSDNVLSDGAQIEVTPIGITISSNADNTERFYEGDFYDFVGKARPEGGQWNLEELVDPDLLDQLTGDRVPTRGDITDLQGNFGNNDPNAQSDIATVIGGDHTHQAIWHGAYGDDWTPEPLRDGAINDLRQAGSERQVGDPLRPEDITVIDRGATEAEKQSTRQRMIDGSSDSFWECEYVVNAGAAFNNSVVFDADGNISSSLNQQELRNRAVTRDAELSVDLDIYVTLTLNEQRSVNWLSINPMNFGESTFLQIIEVSTASDEGAEFIPVEGLDRNRFANILSSSVNDELQEEDVAATIAPTRSSFTGQGVFSFPARDARKVRFKIRQTTPVPNPYQRMNIELNRTRSYDFGYTASADTNFSRWNRYMKRTVILSYLQTVQVLTGQRSAGEVAAVTDAAAGVSHAQTQTSGGLFGGTTTRSRSFSLNDSGWQMGRSWLETYYDKLRYAIGIREIGAFSYRYTEKAELVSTEFRVPQGIWKMQLQVDEDIPGDFDSAKRYVQYYVSIDNGGTWTEINPIDHPTIYSNGIPVPKTLTVAENIAGPTPDEEGVMDLSDATGVKLKAVFSNEPALDSAENYSPALKSYRLKIFPKAGN